MKLNKEFAKPEMTSSMALDYAPAVLTVVTQHHEEWDEPVFDPDTGEPTGESEHKSRDWTTQETKAWPTSDDYAAMGYIKVIDKRPKEAPPPGMHYEDRGYAKSEDGSCWQKRYELVQDQMPALADFDNAMESFLRQEREERGYTTREPDCYLTSQVARWAQDARDWVAHRDAVMEYALELINAVSAGQREAPTMEEFIAGMPKISWTYVEGE